MPSSNAAILLTPRSGGSAIAVLRIRGPAVAEFLHKHFSKPAHPGKLRHARLIDGTEIIDDPIVLLSQNSQWADICLHGGPWIVASALALCQREGFAILDPQIPLPVESFDEASDEIEREMLAHLPQALTRPALRMLLNQPKLWREALKESRINPAVLHDQTLWRLLHPPQIAIVGEPNVGKSTLANHLFAAQRSITADIPGTTRDWVGEMADIAGMPAMLLDTPGQRETDDEIERAAISASLRKIEQSDLVIVVLDATRRSETPQIHMESAKQITVVNKIDKCATWDFAAGNPIPISAKTGEGIENLQAAIHREMGIRDLDKDRLCWWTDRQRSLLLHLKPEIRNQNPESNSNDK